MRLVEVKLPFGAVVAAGLLIFAEVDRARRSLAHRARSPAVAGTLVGAAARTRGEAARRGAGARGSRRARPTHGGGRARSGTADDAVAHALVEAAAVVLDADQDAA